MELSTDKVTGLVDDHLEAIGFVLGITQKDLKYAMDSGYWKTLSLGQQAELVADIIAGRTVGFTPFPDVASYSPSFDVAKGINTYSEIGAAIWILGEVGLVSAKNGNRGKKFAVGAFIGGMFDPAEGQGSSFGANYERDTYAGADRGAMFAGQVTSA